MYGAGSEPRDPATTAPRGTAREMPTVAQTMTIPATPPSTIGQMPPRRVVSGKSSPAAA